ncbi:MAG: hypothetical protein J6A03_01070 [Lachnospiraceae bacterium]|nr:hypothetical protein [Lachnospiraceae bacterium]
MKRNIIFAVLALLTGVVAAISVYAYQYFYPEKYIRTKDGRYENVAVAKEQSPFPVTQDTHFQVEYYYKEEQRTLMEDVGSIPALLGCNKDGIERYLNDYMRHLSKKEQEEGLTSYIMTSYKGNTIYLRKTYEQPVYYGYYAKSFNGYVVIMKGDGKTVYEYTQIPIHLLPDDIKEQVMNGYYLENESDLYNFLENYSS